MDGVFEARREVTARLGTAAIFLGTAASIAWVLLRTPNAFSGTTGRLLAEIAVKASSLAFTCAFALVFFRPRFGYYLGLIAGMLALPWFVWTELSLYPGANSWIVLNLAENDLEGKAFAAFTKLKILSVALLMIATFCSAVRLVPDRLLLRKSPWCRLTWPAFAGSLLMMLVWFVHDATPYRVPRGCVRGIRAEFRILHVEKHGFRFRETQVGFFRDGKAWVWRHDRHLLQYRSVARLALISLPEVSLPTLERARTLVASDALWNLHSPPAKALHSWNADGGYVVLRDSHPLAFTSEYRTVAPREVKDLFHEIEKLPAGDQRPSPVQDVCLGFCYDPVAALDFNRKHP